jgi:hypothetical protein
VAQLPGLNKHNIEKLVRLEVPGLRLMEDLADVVDRPLYGPDPYGWPRVLKVRGGRTTTFSWRNRLTPLGIFCRPLDNQHHAHHLSATAMYKYSGSPGSEATSIGRDTRCCFNS